jgi:hypothetical protein
MSIFIFEKASIENTSDNQYLGSIEKAHAHSYTKNPYITPKQHSYSQKAPGGVECNKEFYLTSFASLSLQLDHRCIL